MKYTQGYKRAKLKFTAGFYAVVACCLLIVGGASYFALSKISKTNEIPQKTESNSEYKDNTSSYIESVPEIPEITVPNKQTDNETQEVPYSEPTNDTAPSFSYTMPLEGKVLKEHSTERLQFSATFGDMRIHSGIDIECEKGTNVNSMADGTVLTVIKDAAFGTITEIDHGNNILIRYASLEEVSVKEGDTVKMGETIGKAGTVPSECNDKSHIHIEVFKDGKSVPPLKTLGLS